MTSLFYNEPELVVALNTKIISVHPNDLQIFKEILIPTDLTKCGLKIDELQEEKDDENDGNDKKSDSVTTKTSLATEMPIIQQVEISPDHQLMAVTTAGQKALLLYKLRLDHAKLISIQALPKTSSAIIFSKDSKRLLITDKSGDCYEYYCDSDANIIKQPKKLFGHLSIVYDVLWSLQENAIITCDRDDKIRVTNYPQTYEIHGYCLGHKEFVSTLQLINDNILISGSGDGTIRLWNIEESKELCKLDLSAPVIKLVKANTTKQNKYQLAALLFHQSSNERVALCELIYKNTGVDNSTCDNWRFSNNPRLFTIPDITIACNLCFVDDRLYVVGAVKDRLCIKIIEEISTQPPAHWLEMIEEQFKDVPWKMEDINQRFKKKYDNITEYMERKKRRIEEKKN